MRALRVSRTNLLVPTCLSLDAAFTGPGQAPSSSMFEPAQKVEGISGRAETSTARDALTLDLDLGRGRFDALQVAVRYARSRLVYAAFLIDRVLMPT